MHRRILAVAIVTIASLLILDGSSAAAQPLLKSAVQVDPGTTKQAGATFGYRLTYNCSSTSGPCLGAEVVDLLPPEVQFVSTVPASPTGDVAAVHVTPNFSGTGRTQVRFDLVDPLPAGNSGDLIVNVRFPNGSTPDGTVATNTADGINLETSPGTFTTPPVDVTAVATVQVSLTKALTTSPANLDLPESYRLRIAVPNSNGALNLTAVGPVVDTLPPGTVFNGATPAADCQPGCVGTTPATVTWTSPCSLPLTPNQNCDIAVNVTFPSATFPSGTDVTNSFTADVTPLGEPPQSVGPGTVTHPVTAFVPSPGAGFSKNMAGGTPNPPTLDQTFSYDLNVTNNGNVPLDDLVVIDTLPVEMMLTSVTTGAYNGLADFAAGEGVRVSYEKNTAPGVFTLWGSSPASTTNTTLVAPPAGLGAGESVTRVRWEYGQAQPGMAPAGGGARPRLTGRIINPDNLGGPVAIGDTVENCASLAAVYAAGPTNVVRNDCQTFTVSGPFVQLNPAKDNLSGGGPFAPGQTVSYRLRVRSASQSSDPVPLEDLVATDLLPVDLVFSSWAFDAQGTGLPAPQVFEQIPNFAGTGRTLLRWRWNAGSGNLGVDDQVWITLSATIRNGATSGSLANSFTLEHDAPGLGQRCSGSSQSDALDFDGDANTAETLCRATGTVPVAGIAQLVSNKLIEATCDAGAVATSAGTLTGGSLSYSLRVQNVGTVPMQNFVLVDILPFVGDTGVRDTDPRGSQWTPLLVAPIMPPPGTTLYYSTSGNPCRGEVGGPTAGCDPPDWSTVPPEPITATRSFKIEFGDQVVAPFDFVELAFAMATPGDVPPGGVAYNSFAYQADRADGLGALAAEPQKVGVALGACEAAALGDFVWADLDGDGIQDDGPTGLDGVLARLFTPGPDGVGATNDDVPLASTVTATGPGGEAGWYRFPGLAPGSYLVCFEAPPTFVPTTPDAGGDDSTDSDADPATLCTPTVTLAADDDDPDLDAGLVPTHRAALGNYAWFDRNGDGLQNEAVTEGVNGVTVRLHLDDGDGIPEPGSGDPLMAVTATADDVYGQPGHYLFDGLVPGLPYFVEFVLPASATGFTASDAGGDDAVDSDASPGTGTTGMVTLAPDEVNRTLDAGLLRAEGVLSLGDQVWLDTDDDGLFEPENGEQGIDGVRLDLYLDADADGLPDLDEHVATTNTATTSGFAGRYRFGDLAAGDYVVVVSPASLGGGGPLAGLVTSHGNDPAPDPDDDVNGDDNGVELGALVVTRAVTLADNGEPTSEDGDDDSNLTVDLGFVGAAGAAPYDYGDAPDVEAGTAPGDYATTALGGGAYHLLAVGGPVLGACVDADTGSAQDTAATADDLAPAGATFGTCATPGDDEDGVVMPGTVVPGGTAPFTVTATGSCLLDAWVDWNRSGVFGDSAGEQITASLALVDGAPTALTPAVPPSAVPGVTFARFRCSLAGGLSPVGPASSGEVEDHRLGILGSDFGDAPASYPTQGAGAASHGVDPLTPPLHLGACVDSEGDGQPSAGADGDDLTAGTSRVGSCFDDEDGVSFTTVTTACQTAQLTVTAAAAGLLDAWIDFSADGDFDDAGERIFAGQPLVAGAHPLAYAVPCTAVAGTTYARFRFSSSGTATPDGAADDGEVEDHAVNVGAVDFGDAPDSYQTTIAAGGPNHRVVAGFSLGATVDTETDGQPSAGATGDGADEDGVVLPGGGVLGACTSPSLTVTLTNTAGVGTPRLDAWIDLDADGVFSDPRDRVATALPLVPGANVVPYAVPCDAGTSATYARFRLSSTGVATPGGAAPDGEVEDYALALQGLDFGDAPDPTYPTLLASNGARHRVLLAGNPTLGSAVDTEGNGQPTAGASGDDANGDDEDGVLFPAVLVPGTEGSVQITVGATGGSVACWIDLDRDGAWSGAEQIVGELLPGSSVVSRTFAVPPGTPAGTAPTRCRIATAPGLGVTGEAGDGEVEDHLATVGVAVPGLGVAKRLVGVDREEGTNYRVDFELVLENTGNVPLADLQVVENLGAVFAGVAALEVVAVTSPTLTVDPTFDGVTFTNLLAAGNVLAVGGRATIALDLRINSGGVSGPFENRVTATATAPDGTPVADLSTDGDDPDANGNEDPSDDDAPTIIVLPFSVTEIPTLGPFGLTVLSALLVLLAAGVLRRHAAGG
ncbi:MAG TPA: IPTL-CTERM sorting domain-containing protein [Thermoanaerobaculia bacterium]|nr:IPTL-CTERM sorting domain-containing protein [Thermoanaerobaculia bacterium]